MAEASGRGGPPGSGAVYEHAPVPGLTVSFQRYASAAPGPGPVGGSARTGTGFRDPPPGRGTTQPPPPSAGALPLWVEGGGLVVPRLAGESFWIGLRWAGPGTASVSLLARAPGGRSVDALDGSPLDARGPVRRTVGTHLALRPVVFPHPTDSLLLGVRVQPPATRRQRLRIPPVTQLDIRLVGADEFERLCGCGVPPLDPGAAYGGWLLP